MAVPPVLVCWCGHPETSHGCRAERIERRPCDFLTSKGPCPCKHFFTQEGDVMEVSD